MDVKKSKNNMVVCQIIDFDPNIVPFDTIFKC